MKSVPTASVLMASVATTSVPTTSIPKRVCDSGRRGSPLPSSILAALLFSAVLFLAAQPKLIAQPNLAGQQGGTARGREGAAVELVESFPVETGLDHPAIRNTREVWMEMLRRARSSIDIEQFYIANAPGEALEEIIRVVEAAASRGVRVRVIGERKFSETYPETLARLAAAPGVEVRLIDLSNSESKGVMHAKYFIVDNADLFVGSQNWDWRALTHINEIGLRVRDSLAVDAFARLFAYDWALAGGAAAGEAAASAGPLPAVFPHEVTIEGERVELTPVFSPRGLLPEGAVWDATALAALIDNARDSLKLQLLSYGTYDPLEHALLGAAARGVRVSLLVSDWSLSRSRQKALKRLQQTEGITVRFTSIPEHSGGFISYARVEHCKYLLVDDNRAWVGTSNWSPDYFEASRNAGFVLRSTRLATLLHEKFALSWDGPHVTIIDPDVEYENRRRDDGSGK